MAKFYDVIKKGVTVKPAPKPARRSLDSYGRQEPARMGRSLRQFNPETDSYRGEEAVKVLCYTPATFLEAKALTDKLKDGEAVMVDLNACDEEIAQRILDFLSGAAYALGGESNRVRESVFLLSSAETDILIEDR